MNTEKSKEIVSDVEGDVDETGPNNMNNDLEAEVNSEIPDVGNLAVTMNYLSIGATEDDAESTEDMEDELNNNVDGAAALPDDMMGGSQETSQMTTRITRAIESEDWGHNWMFTMRMPDREMVPVSITPATTVGTVTERIMEEFGPNVVYFGFQYTANGVVIPANPAMTIGELAEMKITMAFELNTGYEDTDD